MLRPSTYWAGLASRPPWTLNADEERSVGFHLAAQSPQAGAPRTRNWLQKHRQLREFVTRNGFLPRERTEADVNERVLESWVRRQRTYEGQLCTYQREAMDSIPGFDWDPLGEAWEARFYELADRLELHGRWPSHHSADPSERKLGVWVRHQRRMLRAGKLRAERLAMWRQLDGTSPPDSHPADS